MKKIIACLLFVAGGLSVYAQGIMNFPKETHDFGTIAEGTLAEYEFEFTNTGDQPIEITKVQASCGCTSPSWSKEAVLPGKKGRIKAAFDSNGRPGPFAKTLSVYSNAKKSMMLLNIKGYVQAKNESGNTAEGVKFENTPERKAIPPSLKLDRYEFNFGKVESGEKVRQQFTLFNAGGSHLIITALESKCNCVTFSLTQNAIAPDQSAILELTFNADKVQTVEELFIVRSNDPAIPAQEIKLRAEVQANFTKTMFKEKKKSAPFE
ncbi:MAG: DUF1573 domain-containing protein [Microscillaceae bacterium]|jgi:hypothetical protein|nr:DUF1573 domain-containing protein [Microscillaceae bacterium]